MDEFRFPPSPFINCYLQSSVCTPNGGFLYFCNKAKLVMYIPPNLKENPISYKPLDTKIL